jgi:hypothetical protein
MKHIFYLLDGFTPMSLKRELSTIYDEKHKRENFLEKLSKRSLFFKNCYGYGETYSTVYSMINGKNIYDNYCDAPEILFSFKKHYSLIDHYKNRSFKTIYFRNAKAHYPTNGFYNRFNKSFAKSFDHYCLKKKNINYDLKNYLLSNNNFRDYNNKFNVFYFIHDMTFHDDKMVYNGNIRQHFKAFDKASKKVNSNLKLLNYNKSKDTLFFLSDHGLSTKPYNKIHTEKFLSENKYENYYKSMFLDEKIKFVFFINSPKIKKKVINQYVNPSNIFSIIIEYNNKQFKYFYKKIKKILNETIIISLKNAKASKYGNYILNNIFHFHFIKISPNMKYIYSHKHKYNCLIEKDNTFKRISFNKLDKQLIRKIKNYYNFKNLFKKVSFFFISYLIKFSSKIVRKLKIYK